MAAHLAHSQFTGRPLLSFGLLEKWGQPGGFGKIGQTFVCKYTGGQERKSRVVLDSNIWQRRT
jgi:hypothetical protein